jgi:predicted KAP-like P-loop ATPase
LNAGDKAFIANALQNAITQKRKAGGTKAALILDTLNLHAERISLQNIEPLLSSIFEVADKLDIEADNSRGFSIGSNHLRIHWLLRSLTNDRTTLQQRSTIFSNACQDAALSWLENFVSSAWVDYHPREGNLPEPEAKCLVTEGDLETLRIKFLQRVTNAAQNGELLKSPNLPSLLYRWRDLACDDGLAVKAWTTSILDDDQAISHLAKAFTSYGWQQGIGGVGLGDHVARRITHADVNGLDSILDVARFRTRLETLENDASYPHVSAFMSAWRKREH